MANTTDRSDLTPDTHHIRNVEVHHEESDVDAKSLYKYLLTLAAGIAVVFGLSYLMFRYLDAREKRDEERPASLLEPKQDRLPPEPRLQLAPGHVEHPLDDIKKLRAEEDQRLTGYGWANQQAGAVRIPIDEAKKLIVQRYGGAAGPTTQTSPQVGPSDAQQSSPQAAPPHAAAPQATTPTGVPFPLDAAMPADSSSGRTLERKHQ
jgi:hypothetical protein